MADLRQSTDGPTTASEEGYDASLLPDFDKEFLREGDLEAFAEALSAPDTLPEDGATSPGPPHGSFAEKGWFLGREGGSVKLGNGRPDGGLLRRGSTMSFGADGKPREKMFITAQNDWAPVIPKKAGKRGKKGRRRKNQRRDETREGHLYTLLKWPMLVFVGVWVVGLGASYLLTRLYIWTYENFVAWRGKRNRLRTKLYAARSYKEWVGVAEELDQFLGNEGWKSIDEYAYYDSTTVRRVYEQIRKCRKRVEEEEKNANPGAGETQPSKSMEELRNLIQACVKNNFVGVENSRLYSQTYYGTKNLVQDFIDEGKSFKS